MKFNAYIIHKSFEGGSLLLLLESFGLKIWLRPNQIINYNDLNPSDHAKPQEIEVREMVFEMIQYDIEQKKQELLKYNKKTKM